VSYCASPRRVATLTCPRNTKWLPFLLPPQDQEDYLLRASGMLDASESTTTTPFLRRLLDETADLTDSPAFSHVLTLLLDSGFSLLIDHKIAAQAYKIPPVSQSSSRVQELVAPGEAKTKLANTLAGFCRQAHAIGSGATNEYLTSMEQVRDLEAFAAVVYSSNFDFETPEAGSVPLSAAPDSYLRDSGESRPGTATTATTLATPGAVVTPAVRPAKQDDADGDVPPADADASLVDISASEVKDAPAEPEPRPAETTEVDLEKAWGKALANEDGQAPVAAS
jgi:Peroxin-3